MAAQRHVSLLDLLGPCKVEPTFCDAKSAQDSVDEEHARQCFAMGVNVLLQLALVRAVQAGREDLLELCIVQHDIEDAKQLVETAKLYKNAAWANEIPEKLELWVIKITCSVAADSWCRDAPPASRHDVAQEAQRQLEIFNLL